MEIELQRVFTRDTKEAGQKIPGKASEYLIRVEKNKKIEIFKEKDGTITPCAVFELGDEAEYDSYNLNYTGSIIAISDKTVTIQKSYGSRDVKKHRLHIYEFCWRNYNFDAEKIRQQNAETSMYI
jgi:hypothetical protein